MTPIKPACVEDLIHPDGRVFERGIQSLASVSGDTEESAIARFTAICDALATTTVLGATERERRTTLILRHAPRSSGFFRAIGASARDRPPDIRNAVVRFLPPDHKQLVYGKPPPSATLVDAQKLAKDTPAEPAEAVSLEPETGDSLPEVLLLGTAQEQESNLRLLERVKYRPRRAGSFEEFCRLLTGDVSGIVVGRSWWALINGGDHEDFVRQLCDYSSFAWVKIDIDGCSYGQNFIDTCRETRYRDATLSEVVIGDASVLNDVDLASLRRAADLIDNPKKIRLFPADIQPSQAQVLIAGIVNHVHSRHYQRNVRLEEIGATTIPGGRSQALIIRAEPDDGGLPFIAKLASIELLRGEMERFQRFILPWDDVLRPQFHFHDSQGAIIFGLVGTTDQPLHPAPTLDDTIRKVLQTESGAPNCDLPSETDMVALIERTIRKITSLNERPCPENSTPSFNWIDVETFNAMVERGIQWQLAPLRDGRDPLSLRHNAVNILDGPLRTVATTHGDLHLRNVLVRDFRDPFLIDYAYSGPGHPCFDLVRFESALLFQLFRMTQSEERVRDLFTVVFGSDTNLNELNDEFPELCASLGNRFALTAVIGARSACLQLLRQYNGTGRDYLAMKLVIACQSLTMQQLQTGIVRAAIGACAQLLDE